MTEREHARLLLHLCGDECFVAGVGGAVAHFAERAGLAGPAGASVAAALEAFCRETLPPVDVEHDTLDVSIEDFEDRLEIVVEHHGAAGASARLASFRQAGARFCERHEAGAEPMRTFDRVECEARNGTTRAVLVQYLKS